MINLVLLIIISTLIIAIFRLFKKFNINTLQAITINYFVAALYGFSSIGKPFSINYIYSQPWFIYSILTGITLIIAFNLFAFSSQKSGVAITAISSRLSVVIPVLFGFILFNESVNYIKISGLIIALVAFYFALKKNDLVISKKKYLIFPILLFIAIGTNDSLIKFAQYFYIKNDYLLFLATAFLFALFIGSIVLFFDKKNNNLKINLETIIAGIILGLLNWWSTLFFLKGLSTFDVSVFIPIYNVGVVVLSSLTGFIIFKEKLSKINWIGIFLAVISIFLIAFS